MPAPVLFIACLVFGILLKRSRLLPTSFAAALNRFIVAVLLPAVTLLHLHELRIDSSVLVAAAAPWVLFVFGVVLFVSVGQRWGLSRETIGCLILAAGLGNTSFVGYPAILAFYGADALGVGILSDQLGTFVILSVLGSVTAATASGAELHPRALVARIFKFPPFLAAMLALALRAVTFPPWLISALTAVGVALTPLALVAVGLHLHFGRWRGQERIVGLGLGFKLVLGPAIVVAIFRLLPLEWTRATEIGVFQCAMPPMITGALVAIDHGLDEPLATLLVGVGIPLSLLTLPLWWWGLGYL